MYLRDLIEVHQMALEYRALESDRNNIPNSPLRMPC